MKLPKIKNEQLPPELREILGDGDAEFDAIVDPMDVLDIQLDPDAYYEDRHKTALMLVEARKKLNEYRSNETQEIRSKQQRKILKTAKEHPDHYTDEELQFVKMIKRSAKRSLEKKQNWSNDQDG